MDAGAAGLSSGLIYAPGLHADAAEVRALATAATRRGGLYATHLRNEADGLFDALDRGLHRPAAASRRRLPAAPGVAPQVRLALGPRPGWESSPSWTGLGLTASTSVPISTPTPRRRPR